MFNDRLSKHLVAPLLTLAGLLVGCASSETTVCPETGRICPSGTKCVSRGEECAVTTCGDGVVDLTEECDDGKNDNLGKGDKCSATCLESVCGNKRLDFNEVCDPTVADGGATCNSTCTSDGTCGNDIRDVHMGEECDGRDLPPGFELYRCSDKCKIVSCGNGILEKEAGEECDPAAEGDPNRATCNSDCTISMCGDGKRGPDEVCDPGEDPDCNSECGTIKGCGNGTVDEENNEECDPAPEADGPTDCAPNCKWRGCGNGYIDTVGEHNEVCDDGNTVSGDGCSANCLSREVCGNGVLDRDFKDGDKDPRWELCDDGNRADGDLCSKDCKVSAACGNGRFDPGEDQGCDNGPGEQKGRTVETADCNFDCHRRRCGDGIKNATAGETCDDNTPTDTENCNGASAVRPDNTSVACKVPECGDLYVNNAAGEVCEPIGPTVNAENDSETCNGPNAKEGTRCLLSRCGDGYVNDAAHEKCEPSLSDGFDGTSGNSPECNSADAPEHVRCQPARCGDGYANPTAGEACDDGPRETSTCNRSDEAAGLGVDCHVAVCGDGYVNKAAGEQCDPGMLPDGSIDWSGCNGPTAPPGLRCRFSVCGDGYIHESECGEVDDAQYCNGSTAPAGIACKPGRCGDGYVNSQAGESCDPRQVDSAICNGPGAGERSCQPAVCGDGYVNPAAGEECDPGDPSPNNNGISNADESSSRWSVCNGPSSGLLRCKPRTCGDGFKHPREECDGGNSDTAACNGAGTKGSGGALVECQEARCGDGYVNAAAGEECDPGIDTLNGTVDWGNCNGPTAGVHACRVPRCGDGYKHMAECGETQSSTCNGPQAPSAVGCRPSECGDGYINSNAGEECDTNADTFACNGATAGSRACKESRCGDGYTNDAAGEACDPGDPTPNNNGISNNDERHASWEGCNGPSAGPLACAPRECGDGFRHPGEGCDNGEADTATCNGRGARGTDNASVECEVPECGDGYVNRAAGEECDPNAPTSTWDRLPGENSDPPANACNVGGNLACKRARCGDGYVNTAESGGSGPYEYCDPAVGHTEWFGYDEWDALPLPKAPFPTTCTTDAAGAQRCRFSVCGDGVVSAGEECDPGQDGAAEGEDSANCNGSGAGALACKVRICGDGYHNAVEEECDPGIPGSRCTSYCTESKCGDGIVDPAFEECDIVDGWGPPRWYFCNPPTEESENAGVACYVSQCGDGFFNSHTEYCPGDTPAFGWQQLCVADCPSP